MSVRGGDYRAQFSQPVRQIVMMLVVIIACGAGIYLIYPRIAAVFAASPWINATIGIVFVIGVAACFLQVFQLISAVHWIEDFARGRPGFDIRNPPGLLAPLAALLRSRGPRTQIGTSSARSILDSVATRLDESRDITRYLSNLLIFLGLLGTFYGLATTIPAVVQTIRALTPGEGESVNEVFTKLIGGLQTQLGGMGTAFASSLLGLSGSLVVGLLELFAGHGQNRFYRELEEWLSSITRIGLGSDGGEGEESAVVQVLDQVVGQMEVLQQLYTQADAARSLMEDRIGALATAVDRMAAGAEADRNQSARQGAALAEVMARLADGQERLIQALGAVESGVDVESRMRLRSIDTQLLRILEELSAGRQEAVADLRSDMAGLVAAIRHLGRGAVGRG